ncbi:MAG: hypothetical protein IPK82_09820 [Polyangiaceae bacterium]|nr:hypothetical protein [Polyangiaceae bacterium]
MPATRTKEGKKGAVCNACRSARWEVFLPSRYEPTHLFFLTLPNPLPFQLNQPRRHIKPLYSPPTHGVAPSGHAQK